MEFLTNKYYVKYVLDDFVIAVDKNVSSFMIP